ncbi:hypothetical protein QAD02_020965 [Eretmocerus hayati]|uniref:Uncharacterized protein n=1 Tax=Eretmocerus hayati TaxID=131215 RepID=A0ACC2PP47_9HYME|nr:hypothetical protein QAD02_020965 [Eretmocerus hayati]
MRAEKGYRYVPTGSCSSKVPGTNSHHDISLLGQASSLTDQNSVHKQSSKDRSPFYKFFSFEKETPISVKPRNTEDNVDVQEIFESLDSTPNSDKANVIPDSDSLTSYSISENFANSIDFHDIELTQSQNPIPIPTFDTEFSLNEIPFENSVSTQREIEIIESDNSSKYRTARAVIFEKVDDSLEHNRGSEALVNEIFMKNRTGVMNPAMNHSLESDELMNGIRSDENSEDFIWDDSYDSVDLINPPQFNPVGQVDQTSHECIVSPDNSIFINESKLFDVDHTNSDQFANYDDENISLLSDESGFFDSITIDEDFCRMEYETSNRDDFEKFYFGIHNEFLCSYDQENLTNCDTSEHMNQTSSFISRNNLKYPEQFYSFTFDCDFESIQYSKNQNNRKFDLNQVTCIVTKFNQDHLFGKDINSSRNEYPKSRKHFEFKRNGVQSSCSIEKNNFIQNIRVDNFIHGSNLHLNPVLKITPS